MSWKITGRYPLGIARTSEDGNYEIFSSKPGTGHMLRYPGDPMRHVVSLVVRDDSEEGGHSRILYRHHKLAVAQKFVDLHKQGKVRGEGER